MELDHFFIFTEQDSGWKKFLSDLGLIPTYTRVHPGQGTANCCFCFENAFLEILWVENLAETESGPVKRCQFGPKSQWASSRDVCPFGIAWRSNSSIKTWDYRPPYLNGNLAILVAEDSDQLDQPFMFSFPGTLAPKSWPEAKRGALQSQSGFTFMFIEEMTLPEGAVTSPALRLLEDSGCIEKLNSGLEYSATIRLENVDPSLSVRFALPDFRLV